MTAPRQSSGDKDPLVIIIAVVFAVALLGFWPVMIWHGHGGPTGNDWRWDIHSTVAEAVYLGTVAFVAGMIALGCRPAKPARPEPPARHIIPPAPPGPDPALTMRLLRDLEAADDYAGLVEDARSGEELDYLARNGKLPDGWPFRDMRRKDKP